MTSRWRGFALLLGVFASLCAAFALVVTVAEAWQEQGETKWPEATARIQRCGLDIYTHRPETYWINCRISYPVGAEEVVTSVHSRSVPAPSRVIWQDPNGQTGLMQEWVDRHPEGTPIAVHYHPTKHKQAVLVMTDMPLGGPRTPANLKLLGMFAAGGALLLGIGIQGRR